MASSGDAPVRDDEATPHGRRRWPRRLGLAFGAIALAAVALRAVLPTAIERGAAWAAPRYLGLPVHVENVDLGLLRGELSIEGLSVASRPAPEGEAPPDPAAAPGAEPRGAEALLRWQRVFARIDWRALLDRTLHLRELRIDAPVVRLERNADGRIDPLSHARPTVAPAPEEPEPPAAEEEPSPPWGVVLDRLELRAPDARLVDEASGEALVEFGLEEFGLEAVRVRGPEIGLGGVSVRGPRLRVRRDFVLGGGARSASAAEEPAAAGGPAPAAPAPASAPPGYRIERVAIERAAFTLVTDEGPLDVALGLEASGVTANEGERFPLRIELELAGGRVSLDGQLGILPPSYEGRVAWTNLGFPPLLLAAAPELGPWLRSCRASGDLSVTAQLARAGDREPGVRIAGRTAVEDLAIADPKDQEVSLAWKSLEIAIREVRAPIPVEGEPPGRTTIALERVSLVEPSARYALPSPALDELLGAGGEEAGAPPAPPPAEPAPAASPQPLPFELTLDALAIAGARLAYDDRREGAARAAAVEGLALEVGSIAVAPAQDGAVAVALGAVDLRAERVAFDDGSVKPPYAGRLEALSVSAHDVRFPERAANDLRVHGRSPQGGEFTLTGTLHGDTGDATLVLRRLALSPFNPYASSAAGYELGGDASLETKLRVRGARYDLRNKLVLHELDVSSRDPGDFERRFGVPLDLALALLRDPGGNIALAIPVAADEKGISTGIGTIVAGALRQALVGALTSPLKLVGAAFSGVGGGGGLSLEPLASVAGGAALAGGQDERLAGLAKLAAERPQIAVRLRGRTGAEDRPLVAQQMLIEGLAAGQGLPALEDGAGILARRRISRALEARGRGEPGLLEAEDEAMLARYVGAVEVPADRLASLARSRAERARDAAVQDHAVDPAALRIGDPAPDGPPGVVLEFSTR